MPKFKVYWVEKYVSEVEADCPEDAEEMADFSNAIYLGSETEEVEEVGRVSREYTIKAKEEWTYKVTAESEEVALALVSSAPYLYREESIGVVDEIVLDKNETE